MTALMDLYCRHKIIEQLSLTGSNLLSTYSVCAVIVTYHPEAAVIENIAAVYSQANGVVVVDNGSNPNSLRLLRDAAKTLGFHLIENGENLGIAAALNVGVKWGLEHEYPWVILFDQDSRVSERFIEQMLETYYEATSSSRIAIIAPTYIDRNTGVRVRLMRSSNGEVLTTMTSGSLSPLSIFLECGYFDESLYMDYVDIEYCLRVRRKKMLIRQSRAELFHSLGRTTYHRFFNLRFGATNHSARRRYYITRNRLRLLARYFEDFPWLWRESLATLSDAIKVILVEKDRGEKISAMAKGVRDASLERTGRQFEL